MKKTTALALVLTLVASLAFAGSALAGSKSYRQVGQVVGDKGSTVSLRVKVKNGTPKKISAFTAEKIITRCNDVVKRYNYSALSPIPVSGGSFNIILTDSSIGLKITLEGDVRNKGKSVVGTIKTNKFKVKGKTCKVSKQKFKTAVL